jgi:zinc-ribbon domain
MAGFCASCGSPLADGTRFCEKCGTAVIGQPATTGVPMAGQTPVHPMAAPGTSKGSSTAVKVIIAILAVGMFLVLLVAGSCFYIVHRARHEFSKALSVPPYTGKREPCAMLTTDEASSALGQPVISAETFGPAVCRYSYGSEGRQFNAQYTWQGGAMAMGVTQSIMKHVSNTGTFTPVEGIGDEAMLGPMGSTLMMRKGDVMVNMDLRVSGVSVSAAEKMARIIADHLRDSELGR